MKTLNEAVDVVVVGGGTSGEPAAIGAARHGARTLVVEYQHGLGGVGPDASERDDGAHQQPWRDRLVQQRHTKHDAPDRRHQGQRRQHDRCGHIRWGHRRH